MLFSQVMVVGVVFAGAWAVLSREMTPGGLAACMMRAQAYVANSSIGRDLPENEAFKVICVRRAINRVDKVDSGPSNSAR